LTPDDEPVGSLGSEAAQLLEALQDWARDAGSDQHIATGSPACTYCPLCRVISALRDNPEVREHLSTAASSLMEAVVGILTHGADPEAKPDTDTDREQDREAD
jgi:hypothetical protein